MKRLVILHSFIIAFSACNETQDSTLNNDNIYGHWQLTELYVVNGVDGEWAYVENGYVIKINNDDTFSSSQYSECTEGTISFSAETITLAYGCDDFSAGIENPKGVFSYNYSVVDGKLSLVPLFLSCDEGCGYRFSKI